MWRNCGRVISLLRLVKELNLKIPESIEKFIAFEAKNVEAAEKILDEIAEVDDISVTYKVDEVKLLAPIVSPSKLICLGLNY